MLKATRGWRRLEGAGKVTGGTRFTQDFRPAGTLIAKLVLSQVPAGRISSVDATAALALPGVVMVVTGADLPETPAAGPDKPLAVDRVFYAGQPVAAVLATSAQAAADGAAAVFVDYEELPAAVTVEEAMGEGAPRVLPERAEGFDDASIHGGGGGERESGPLPTNTTGVAEQRRGDLAAALAAADVVVEGRFVMPAAHQGFLETHSVVAAPAPDGGVVIWSPTQGHHFVRKELAGLAGGRVRSVTVEPMPVGGGFGGKVVLLEPLAVLLALHARRPVAIDLTRNEEFLVGRAAPWSSFEVKVGARRDGTFTGLEVRAIFDNGATNGWHGTIAGFLITSIYRFDAIDFQAYEVATNKNPADAYRAPGGTQAFHALESVVDDVARRLGMDPIELRLKNAVREGDWSAANGSFPRIGFVEVLEAARRHPLYTAPAGPGEGVGVAAGFWNGAVGAAAAACKVEADGSFTLQLGSVDISGSSTSLAMVAAEALGVSPDAINVEIADTGSAPAGPTAGGSAVVYSVAPAVKAAAEETRRQLFDNAADELEAAPEDLEIADGHIRVRGVPDRRLAIADASGGTRLPVHGFGRVHLRKPSPGFTVHIARVRVDAETGDFRLTGYAALQDVGRALNPPEVEGQVMGGALQGLGRAVGEQLLHDSQGQLRTATLADYELPTIDQAPDFAVELLEIPSDIAPLGNRPVGEPPNTCGPAAVANAVRSAAGVRIDELPITAERLHAALA